MEGEAADPVVVVVLRGHLLEAVVEPVEVGAAGQRRTELEVEQVRVDRAGPQRRALHQRHLGAVDHRTETAAAVGRPPDVPGTVAGLGSVEALCPHRSRVRRRHRDGERVHPAGRAEPGRPLPGLAAVEGHRDTIAHSAGHHMPAVGGIDRRRVQVLVGRCLDTDRNPVGSGHPCRRPGHGRRPSDRRSAPTTPSPARSRHREHRLPPDAVDQLVVHAIAVGVVSRPRSHLVRRQVALGECDLLPTAADRWMVFFDDATRVFTAGSAPHLGVPHRRDRRRTGSQLGTVASALWAEGTRRNDPQPAPRPGRFEFLG
jgi:hypothetical protein